MPRWISFSCSNKLLVNTRIASRQIGSRLRGIHRTCRRVGRTAGLAWLRGMAPGWRKPAHASFILDGNRRYAVREGLECLRQGHQKGSERFMELLEYCFIYGIRFVSVYALSLDNLKRSKEEVAALVDFARVISDRLADPNSLVHRIGCRVRIIGNCEVLPEATRDAIDRVERATEGYSAMTLFLSGAYDGREELVRAANRCAFKASQTAAKTTAKTEYASSTITVETLNRHMYVRDHDTNVPPVDLVVRTGGARRLSGFLMWDTTHAEIHFTPVLWPEFDEYEFLRALQSFDVRVASSQEVHMRYA